MATKQRFPSVRTTYYPLKGGVDLVSPSISKSPGVCFDAKNYEPVSEGGYRRINGYERSDGRTSPTSAVYWRMGVEITGSVAVDDVVTGATSSATGKVLAVVDSAALVLGRVSGTFEDGETLNVSASAQATAASTAEESGETSRQLDAEYRLLAADDRRADIEAVPGSGAVRGVFVYGDVVYAFRDNAGGTAGDLYKQTAAGWSQVSFGREVQFTGATAEVAVGDTVTGATSGASATVVRAMLRTGTWASAGAGTLILSGVTGTFQDAENIQVGGATKAVASGADTAIARVAGGRVESVLANFTGSASTRRIYGADGVNLAFEFDGTNYVPIRTGMSADTPTHIEAHKSRLFLSFGSSLQYSGVNQPYSWTALTGAAEIGMGDAISCIKSLSGSEAGASLLVAVESTYSILYGSSTSDFDLVPSGRDLGYDEHTVQGVGNDVFGLTSGGIRSLAATQNYGSFNYSAISTLVQPFLDERPGLQTASVSLKAKNQFRLFFSDKKALAVGLTGGKISGIMPLEYLHAVRCVCNAKLSTGDEVTYFGSDDGWVFKDNTGTSFDGEEVEAYIRPAFNNLQSPLMRKSYLRAMFEVESEGFCQINATYDLGYGTPDVAPPAEQEDQQITGAGGYWDQFNWDSFTWDAPLVSNAYLSIEGTENNISFLFYSSRAQDDPHTVQGVNLMYVPRRLTRGGA